VNQKDLFLYTLHLADNALIMGQRNSAWTGHGPVLEQDIAITNLALDFLGQARNLYSFAASVYEAMNDGDKHSVDAWLPRPWKNFNRELQEDDLAFLRDERQYLNLLLTELPGGDWAQTILRQFFFSAFQFYQYEALEKSSDANLAAIAEKSLKEVAYHLRWSAEWVIRLGDGTEESHDRIYKALQELWPFIGELFMEAGFEKTGAGEGWGLDPTTLKTKWMEKTEGVLQEATLEKPKKKTWAQSGGKEGLHTEHLGYLLTEMQYMQRTYPNVVW
jgi:ring-1,2-phenylacetyl-CoA epoxidase subunit PaaC